MQNDLEKLKNIGPKTAHALAAVGIADEAALRKVGPVEAWRRLKAAAPKETSLVGLYAIYGALVDVHWNDLPAELKAELKKEALT